jgi:hypothetical protein
MFVQGGKLVDEGWPVEVLISEKLPSPALVTVALKGRRPRVWLGCSNDREGIKGYVCEICIPSVSIDLFEA